MHRKIPKPKAEIIINKERIYKHSTKDLFNNFDFHMTNYANFSPYEQREIHYTDNLICYKCGTPLLLGYSYIIKKLKKAILIDKEYKPICCYCKDEENEKP